MVNRRSMQIANFQLHLSHSNRLFPSLKQLLNPVVSPVVRGNGPLLKFQLRREPTQICIVLSSLKSYIELNVQERESSLELALLWSVIIQYMIYMIVYIFTVLTLNQKQRAFTYTKSIH